MSYKYFGRLAGGSNAGDSLVNTAESNTTTPFSAQRPATKFMAYGEAATSLNINRALAALSANNDHIASILDSPALRKDILTPQRDNTVPNTLSGFDALNDTSFNDSFLDLASGKGPAVWVYVGLHKDSLKNCIRLYRVKDGQYAQGPYPDISEMDVVYPIDVRISSVTATSYFSGNQGTYTGTPELAMADRIPGITIVAPSLVPYGGNPEVVNIAAWDEDGPRIGDAGTTSAWADLYARPGCFVLVSGETPTTNNGLYRIASISGTVSSSGATSGGDKAVLTRGGLHRVTVDDGTKFDVGRRVTWRSAPLHNAVSVVNNRENSAYVLYIIFHSGNSGPADLYVSSFSGPEDFATTTAATAYRIIDDVNVTGPLNRVGSIGLVDQEAEATDNWSLLPKTIAADGTYLYNHTTGLHAEVTAALPAGYPVNFATGTDPGNVQLCAPPGFLLNPYLTLDGAQFIGGDYYAYCHTLTTVREKLTSVGQSLNRFTYENPADRLFFTEGDENRYESFSKYLRVGNQDQAQATSVSPASYGPTKQVLGEGLWKVEIDPQSDNGAVDIANENLQPGDILTWVQASHGDPTSVTTSVLVSSGKIAGTNFLILKNVENSSWAGTDFHYANDPLEGGGIQPNPPAGSKTEIQGTNYYILNISYGPYLQDETFTNYVPSFGLNAAYHNHYDASPSARGTRGFGNTIHTFDGRPLTVILPLTPTHPGLLIRAVQILGAGPYDLVSFKDASLPPADMAVVGYSAESITFSDANTLSVDPTNIIPLSDSDHKIIPAQHGGLEQSILGALEGSLLGGAGFSALSSGVLHFGGVSINGFDMSLGESYFHYKGAKIRVKAQVVTAPLAPPGAMLYYDAIAEAYALADIATFDMEDQDKIAVASVKNAGLQVDVFNFCGYTVNRVDRNTDIFVGTIDTVPPLSEYANNIAHFATLGEALKAIEIWVGLTLNPSDASYSITVIGDTFEQTDLTKEITLPLALPIARQITIRGGAGPVAPTVSWDEADRLFNVDGTMGLLIENLNTAWTGLLLADNGSLPQVAPYYSKGNNPGESLTLRGCSHTGGEAFVDIPAFDFSEVVIENCKSATAGGGVFVNSVGLVAGSKLTISNCVFTNRIVATPFRLVGTQNAAVCIGVNTPVVSSITIENCSVLAHNGDGYFRGIRIFDPGDATVIRGNTFYDICGTPHPSHGPDDGAIRIIAAGTNPSVSIDNNSCVDLATVTAIKIASKNTTITDNKISSAVAVTPAGGFYSIEIDPSATSAIVSGNICDDIEGYGLYMGSEHSKAVNNIFNARGSGGYTNRGIIDIDADHVDVRGNSIGILDPTTATRFAITITDNRNYVQIAQNHIKNTRDSTKADTQPAVQPSLATLNIEFGAGSSFITLDRNTIEGNDGGNILTLNHDQGAGSQYHTNWIVSGNALEGVTSLGTVPDNMDQYVGGQFPEVSGCFLIKNMKVGQIRGNTFSGKILMQDFNDDGESEELVIEGNILQSLKADLGAHVSSNHRVSDSVIANNCFTEASLVTHDHTGAIAPLPEGILLDASNLRGNEVTGNTFPSTLGVTYSGVIETGSYSNVTNNRFARNILSGSSLNPATRRPGVVSGNQGGGPNGLYITSYGGSNISNNTEVTLVVGDEQTTVADNCFFTSTTTVIDLIGDGQSVTGNSKNGTGDLWIHVGGAAAHSDDSVVSGNSLNGGRIYIFGSRCTINNNNLDELHIGHSVIVGNVAGAAAYGSHCTITGNILLGGTIFLYKGQNVVMGNILVATEGDPAGGDSKISGSLTGVQGAIIIDAYGDLDPANPDINLPPPSGCKGDYHNNIIVGNLYRSGATGSVGPTIRQTAFGANTQSQLGRGGDGNIIDGNDLYSGTVSTTLPAGPLVGGDYPSDSMRLNSEE